MVPFRGTNGWRGIRLVALRIFSEAHHELPFVEGGPSIHFWRHFDGLSLFQGLRREGSREQVVEEEVHAGEEAAGCGLFWRRRGLPIRLTVSQMNFGWDVARNCC